MNNQTFVRGLALLAFGMAAALPASAYTSVTIFGDSLSDTGNVFVYTGGATPAAPYVGGGFSNGPIWTDLIAAGLGSAAGTQASLMGGSNYAWGGARTNGGSLPSILVQVGASNAGFWGNIPADPTGLYIVVGGGNDMRDARSSFSGNTAADQAGRQAAAQAAIASLQTALQMIAAKGGKNVLLSNVPDLGNTPEAQSMGAAVVAASSDASARFNALVPGLISSAQGYGLNVSFFDMAATAAAIRSDALNNGGAIYGITNVLYPCAGFPGNVGTSCAVSAFSDALHPSAVTHAIFAATVLAAVPEPASVLLMAVGLAGVLVARRRRSAA